MLPISIDKDKGLVPLAPTCGGSAHDRTIRRLINRMPRIVVHYPLLQNFAMVPPASSSMTFRNSNHSIAFRPTSSRDCNQSSHGIREQCTTPAGFLSRGDEYQGTQVSRYLVKDFGTSKSPKSTRKRDAYCASDALRPCRFALHGWQRKYRENLCGLV